MRKYLLLILVFVLANSQLQLTSENFIEHLAANEFVFVKFYSPNCAYCIAIGPEYEQFAIQAEGKLYKVAEMDCSEHREMCQQNGVKGYPTFKLFVSGSAFTYEGKKSAEALSNWMEEITSLKLEKLSLSQAKKKIGKETFVLISGLSQKVQRVVAVTSALLDYKIKYYSFDSQGYIKLYSKGSLVPLQYNTDQNFPLSLVEWAFEKTRPALIPLETQVLKYAKQQIKSNYLLIAFEKENIVFDEISSWCSKNLDKVLCLSVNKESSVFEQISKITKIPETKFPLAIIKKDFSTGSHYPYESISSENLTSFLQSVKANRLPHDIDALRDLRELVKFNNVVKLDSSNYYQTITENQYVFVYYYSPTCGHCVKFASEYDRIGKHFNESGSKVVIAAIDAGEETEIKQKEKVHGFPHFRLFIRGSNRILYRLDRKADAMIQFVESASKAKLTKVQSLEEISDQTFALLTGVLQNTYLHALPALFKNCTIYLLPSEGNLSLSVHNGGNVFNYKGKADFWDIYDWLDVEFSPILSSLGVSTPAKRLQKALISRIPILLVLNKHERSAVDQLLLTLQRYCIDKRDFVCGYVHSDQEDYNMLNNWLGDNSFPDNSIFWVDTDTNTRYKYSGSLSEVSIDTLATFVQSVKNGLIPVHLKPAQESKTASEQL